MSVAHIHRGSRELYEELILTERAGSYRRSSHSQREEGVM